MCPLKITFVICIKVPLTLNFKILSVQAFLYACLETGRIMVLWCLTGSPSVSQSQFSALLSYMLGHIELKLCMSLSSYEHSIKFEWRKFPSICVGVMPLLGLWILEIHSFVHFSLTCFTYWAIVLHMPLFHCTTGQVWMPSICVNFCGSYAAFRRHINLNFIYDFVLLCYRSRWSVLNLRELL